MTPVAGSVDRFVAEFERLAARQRAEPRWLLEARRRGMERFETLGFPTTADEQWRFTSVAPIAEASFVLAAGASEPERAGVAPFLLGDLAVAELVFVDGRFASGLSTQGAPDGIRVESLASALSTDAGRLEAHLSPRAGVESRTFVALNTAFLADGAVISVPPGTVQSRPIHVLSVSGGAAEASMTHPRALIVVGDGAEVSIVESYVGRDDDAYFTNAVTEIVVGENATVDHYRMQRESCSGYHVGTTEVTAAANATYRSHAFDFGGLLVRNDLVVKLDGEGGECLLDGLYVVDRRRLIDNHTTIDHAMPHCGSREMYKGILADRARAVFNGRIIVRPGAQKTDAKQTNKALLLSEEAQVNTQPQLEIFANDVRCTHGAAVGQMDDDAIFYLRSRGLSLEHARRLLLQAFAAGVLDRIPFAPLRTLAEAEMMRRLPGAAAGRRAT
jgi:Fe-S cluster assembly protein SufD